ncbi:MAG: hypothetical protein HKN07_05165 [Acidimicrobiia bacterium]|nr:hypothetical protein [Acidimicrobiia bacterium]
MNTTKSPKATKSPNRVLAIVGGLAVIAVILTVVVGNRAPAPLDPGTPQATVQTFVQAMIDGDLSLAEEQLSTTLSDDCRSQLRNAWIDDSVRVALDDVEIDEDRATVTATIQTGSTGLFDSYRGSNESVYELVFESGEWRIDHAGWPYFYCEEGRP